MTRFILFSTIVLTAVSFALYGCGSTSKEVEETLNPATDTSEEHDGHGDHMHDDHGMHDDHTDHGKADMEKMKAELAKLSPEDAASAEKQHFCPVSGEMLGTMGAPVKVDVNGQQVWICCEGCKDKLLANPDEYLAKLQKE